MHPGDSASAVRRSAIRRRDDGGVVPDPHLTVWSREQLAAARPAIRSMKASSPIFGRRAVGLGGATAHAYHWAPHERARWSIRAIVWWSRRKRARMSPTQQSEAARLGGRGGGAHHPGRGGVVRRLAPRSTTGCASCWSTQAPSPGCPTPSARTATGPARTPATWPGSRTAPSSAPSARSTPARPTTGVSPTRCAGMLNGALPAARCGAGRCTWCPSRWARSARRSPTSACS